MSDENTVYLGDAVYAAFDGCGIELRLNDHRSRMLIYLEPEVVRELIEFWNSRVRDSGRSVKRAYKRF